MIRRTLPAALFAVLLAPVAARAQAPLTLPEAIARARAHGVEARLARKATEAAEARVAEARAGYMPRLDVSEGWQRGDQPVFVFSSLLAQRQFTAANFAIDALNHPDPVSNFRAALTAQQLVYDGGAREATLQLAKLGGEAAAIGERQAAEDVALGVTVAFADVVRLEADAVADEAARDAATADLRRARDRRDAGLVTDADVLALSVHESRMEAQAIRAHAEATVARARLNQWMGAPLDEVFVLDPGVQDAVAPEPGADEPSLIARPDVLLARLQERAAEASHAAVRAAILPQVSMTGGWEWNGSQFADRAGSWFVGAEVRINLFRGLADRARLAETSVDAARRSLERDRTETAARVDVRAARARLDAARATERVGRASVVQARESQRIIRDRYENGLLDVSSLLRAAESVLTAEAQVTSARVDVLVQGAALDRALGR